MIPLRLSRAVAGGSAATMIVGLALLSAAWWLSPIGAAERALASGDADRAALHYDVSRRRLDRTIFASSLFPALSDLVTRNELSLQYSLRRYDRILEITAGSDTALGDTSFWAGCALFDKALVQADRDAKLGLMSDAQQAFRRALDAAPGDWDARFNYEMTGRWLSILREQPDASTEETIKLLRERVPQPRGTRRTG